MTRSVFLHVFSSFGAAGRELRTIEIIRALSSERQHLILALDGNTDAASLLPDQSSVQLLPRIPKAGSIRTTLRLARVLRETNPELLLTYNFGAIDALLAARMVGGPPAIHHEDGFRPDEVSRLKWRRSALRRFALPAASKVVVVSETLRTIALGPWRQTPNRVRLIPNGIEVERFLRCTANRHDLRSRLGIPHDVFVVGTVGHLRPEKGQARLLAAVDLVNGNGADMHVLFAGDGPERGRLQQLSNSAALNGRVHFMGHTQQPQDAYGAMDLYALTSDTEQMPISLLEAMAAGLPVVATDVGDVRRMLPTVQHPDVINLDSFATQRLGERIEAQARNPERRSLLGMTNKEHVTHHYDQQAMIERYRALYTEVLEEI